MKYTIDEPDADSGSPKRKPSRHYDMRFLLGQLVKRDFISKYKRTYLGVLWSVLGPLFTALVMVVVFTNLMKSRVNGGYYIICGSFFFSYFNASTHAGMNSLAANALVFSRLNIPKFVFVIASSLSSLVNFGITLVLLFAIMPFVGISFDWTLLALPVILIPYYFFNLGISFVLSSLYVYFRDLRYLYGIITQIIVWFSAIFYYPDFLPESVRWVLTINPVFHIISYARSLMIEHTLPGIKETLVIYAFAAVSLLAGILVYRYNSNKLYYYIDA
jgi:ABC-2 type transport system permease protein